MSSLYPFRMRPIFRDYPWGGRRLGSVLGKPIGEGSHFAESWEIVDHGDDQSVVAAGELAGKTLSQLVAEHGEQLLGKHHPQAAFPLLYKFLDAQRTLSVQVHPDDALAAKLTPPDLGKTEAWYILAAEPGSLVYAGLKPGTDRDTLASAIAEGVCENYLHAIPVRAGNCVFLPAGIVHAIGGGLLIAEIQQASDTTFRLYDWNYVGPDGQPRELHVEQGLAATDFAAGPVAVQTPVPTERPHVARLVECDKFVWDRWSFDEPAELRCGGGCHIISVLAGELSVVGDPAAQPTGMGQTWLIPAGMETVTLAPHGPVVMLDAYLPE
jgi:mannose-6-phosphate isomerase